MYKFSELNKLGDKFMAVFDIGFKPFYDGLMSVASKHLCIDIMKFDEWLHEKHGDYENAGQSMDDCIREHYGEEGVKLINEVTDMAKELKNDIVERTGIKTVVERTVGKTEVTYQPYGNYHKGLTVEQVVYDLMTIAAQDMLDCGQAIYGGDYTAAEMAGKAGYLFIFMESEHRTIRIRTETFCCSYGEDDVFSQMAEWEGVMNLASKNYRRFHCEGKEMPKDVKLKPYTRCHGYKPTAISLTAENARIAKKFEVLGAMAKALTSEGMRRALAVIDAADRWDHADYDIRDMARKAMEWKLWKDYGRTSNQFPIHFSRQDFKDGPEVWKQGDRDYAARLVSHFERMLAESPAPEWPKKGDMVMLKGRERMAKKYQGKFLCEGVKPRLSTYGESIEWYAMVRTKKYDCEDFLPGQLEAVPDEPKKAKKSKAKTAKAKADKAARAAAEIPQHTEPAAKAQAKPSLEDAIARATAMLMAA